MKRPAEPPLTPAASVDENMHGGYASSSMGDVLPGSSTGGGSETTQSGDDTVREPPKKKRRAVLTRVSDVPS